MCDRESSGCSGSTSIDCDPQKRESCSDPRWNAHALQARGRVCGNHFHRYGRALDHLVGDLFFDPADQRTLVRRAHDDAIAMEPPCRIGNAIGLVARFGVDRVRNA